MERARPGDRIQPLAMLLAQPAVVAAPAPAAEPPPDPRVQLEAERQRVLATAEQAGYQKGLERAEEEIRVRAKQAEERIEAANAAERQRLAQELGQLEALLKALPRAVDELEAQQRSVVLELTFAALSRVLGAQAADGTLVRNLCAQALDEYRQRPVVLRVAEGQVQSIEALATEDVRVVADARLAPHQCRLETLKGTYDAGLDVRLDAIAQALLRSVGEAE